ncbi:MAG: PfkB family carbohydrate kinase [Planctomycetota bacterium]|nr:PfkB family carbohydrate kinase [Planctomycetota bacterium]
MVIIRSMSLVVTGTIGIDTVETASGQAEGVMGGSCTYFAAAASLLAPVRIVAAVGDDWPEDHAAVLAGFSGIDQAGLEHRSGSKTFRWGGRYHDDMNGRDTLFTELGVLEEAPPPVPTEYADSRYIFLANTHPAVQLGMLEHFPDRAIVVADTMDLWIDIALDDLKALLVKLDGLVINDSEAFLLSGEANVVSAAEMICSMGPSFVVVKKGEHGAYLHHPEGCAALPALPLKAEQVVDPTGCGDSFAGGMMGHISARNGCDLATIKEALAWGTVAASHTIEDFGLAGLQSATMASMQNRFDQFRLITSF